MSAVPNNETFTLNDVYNSVNSHSIQGITPNLVACFSEATSNRFDPTYNNISYAPANSMKRFRNYNSVPIGTPNTLLFFSSEKYSEISKTLVKTETPYYAIADIYINDFTFPLILTTASNVINNASWETGTVTVRGYIFKQFGENDLTLDSIKIHRVNSTGTIQETFTALTYYEIVGTGNGTAITEEIYCTFTPGNITDRLRVDFNFGGTLYNTYNILIWTGTRTEEWGSVQTPITSY